MTDSRTEAAALVLSGDKQWPTNEELGGGPTGTRDDEFRDQYRDDAVRALAAADGADLEHGIHRVKVDNETLARVEAYLRMCRESDETRSVPNPGKPLVADRWRARAVIADILGFDWQAGA